MPYEALIFELNRLQRRLYDSFREFNTTQDNLATEPWRAHFREEAARRREYYQQIRDTIKKLGSMPRDVTQPFSDAADEIFTDIKTFFSGEDDRLVLQEARVKELKLVEVYQQVLALPTVPDPLRAVLEQQVAQVREELEKIIAGLEAAR